MVTPNSPAASFKFNSFQEIKSHSSILYNERMAILFYLLDMRSIEMNTYHNIADILKVRSILKQIYKNIRTLIRNNPTMRATMNLETKDEGIYITDLSIGLIDRMIEHCELNGYTLRKIHIIVDELNTFELIIKDILQYYHYFIRPDFRQKPDVDTAIEKYKEIADKKTVEELRALLGKTAKINLENLGSDRIELKDEIEYDPDIDGEITEAEKTGIENTEEVEEEESIQEEDDGTQG